MGNELMICLLKIIENDFYEHHINKHEELNDEINQQVQDTN